MRLIVPKPIQVVSNSVPEESYPVWDSSTAYSKDDIVLVPNLEPNGITRKFRSLADNNTGNYPPDNPGVWQDLGATNKWKMFDNYVTSQTVNENEIDVVITGISRADSICLFRIYAGQCYIKITDENDNTVIEKDISLLQNTSSCWSDYLFGEIILKDSLKVRIPFTAPQWKIEIKLYGSSTVKCGHLVIGKSKNLGCTLFGVNAGILDYSKKETNNFGETYLKQGKWAKKAELDVEVKNELIDQVQRTLADLRATPVVWDLNNEKTNYTSLLIYGFYRDFSIVLSNPVVSQCSITVEGLI